MGVSGALFMLRICKMGTTNLADVEADVVAAHDGVLQERLGVV